MNVFGNGLFTREGCGHVCSAEELLSTAWGGPCRQCAALSAVHPGARVAAGTSEATTSEETTPTMTAARPATETESQRTPLPYDTTNPHPSPIAPLPTTASVPGGRVRGPPPTITQLPQPTTTFPMPALLRRQILAHPERHVRWPSREGWRSEVDKIQAEEMIARMYEYQDNESPKKRLKRIERMRERQVRARRVFEQVVALGQIRRNAAMGLLGGDIHEAAAQEEGGPRDEASSADSEAAVVDKAEEKEEEKEGGKEEEEDDDDDDDGELLQLYVRARPRRNASRALTPADNLAPGNAGALERQGGSGLRGGGEVEHSEDWGGVSLLQYPKEPFEVFGGPSRITTPPAAKHADFKATNTREAPFGDSINIATNF